MTQLPICPSKYYLQKVTAEADALWAHLIVPSAFNRALAALDLATITLPAGHKVVKPEYEGFTIVTGHSILTGGEPPGPLPMEPYIPTQK